MTSYYVSIILVRLALPAALLLSIALRPFGLSAVYLVLYLLSPLVSVPNSSTFNGFRGKVLLLNVVVSWVLLSLHIAWHILLYSFPPYGDLLQRYPLLQLIGQNLGLVSYSGIYPFMAIHYIAPELLMAGTSFIVYMILKKLFTSAAPPEPGANKNDKYQKHPFLTSAGKYISLFLIMFSGILRPSVTSGIYFLVFIGSATAWALGQPLKRGFAVVCRLLMAIMAVHVILVIAYQCTWIMDLVPPDNPFARYFGLTKLVNMTQENPKEFTYVVTFDHMWATLASPLVILFTYFVLALETRELFKPVLKRKSGLPGVEAGKLNGSLISGLSFRRGKRHAATADKWKQATKKVRVACPYINKKATHRAPDETTPLIRVLSPAKRLSSIRSISGTKRLQQDSSGSIVVPDDEMEEQELTILDDIIAAVVDFFQVIIRSSYIATSITMMAWSIMFHSWLTFVFLMWANLVWLCQEQRSFMLRSSPLLVCYAVVLLLAQYVYGMNLTEAELPSTISEVNLRQIGLAREDGEPCLPLLIKSLFTCMFWVTLRQRVTEARQRRQSALAADIAAPLRVTVSTATTDADGLRDEEGRSRLLNAIGEWLRAACARYWIYVVAIMLFIIGITGERMTIFRIIYMFLFLSFILMFQISWYWWRRLMYVFWIVVIIYSMVNLILIYIYQFDNFPKTIENYLMIDINLQHDLGLEPYPPADLFVKLLTPTSFLIITIMQVHYFHKDFMALSDPQSWANSVAGRDPGSSRPSQGGASTMKDDLPPLPSEEAPPRSPGSTASNTAADHSLDASSPHRDRSHRRSLYRKASRSYAATVTEPASSCFQEWLQAHWRSTRVHFSYVADLVFLYLEIHLIKIVFISLLLLSVIHVCALHVPIVLLISPALLLNMKRQRTCVLVISTLISIYFMAKMVYQIDYINHQNFNVTCTKIGANNASSNITLNNAEWVGFQKATKTFPLASVLKGYIGLIAIFTLHSLITYRQQRKRSVDSVTPNTEKLVFPEVGRAEADKDMINCIKYLVNFCFYKFGVEITLMCLVGVIGSRMDVYAVLYAAWLLVLVSVTRAQQACIWPAFTGFVTVLMPLQYILSLGFLPQFCISYPWDGNDQMMKSMRTWLFLPCAESPPHATKLVFDYFLLLFCSRQLRVFRIERSVGEAYRGGSNSEGIGHDWETPQFVNPIPDFLGFVGSWLDLVKRTIFLGMLWLTLAIMFLTGTNRVNLFSMGYLIGSFIFLWQGTDFYLRPKDAILRWWSWLLRYNVCVVGIKALLQIPGCMFEGPVQEHACWLVQLLGIGCVDKFAGGSIANFIKMKYYKDATCSVPQEDIGLAWDGVCFAFLILQQRLFRSYYFYRVIDESKATTMLASRGADLIEELRQKQMLLQEDQEMKILEKIKVKMERIKANQKKVRGETKEHGHHGTEDDLDDTQHGESERVPLVRGDSDVSGRGYHTPESPASPRGFHTPISDESTPSSRSQSPPIPLNSPIHHPMPTLPALPAPGQVAGGPPSPSSALMTVSLDAYLEPRRISFESPPSSELLPRAHSPEESYPVFSPPPLRRRHTVASPSLLQRTSIISQSSRADPHSHHTSTTSDRSYRSQPPTSHPQAIRSGDYYMFEEFDDTDVNLQDNESSSDEDAPKVMGIGKLLSTVIKTDVKNAVNLRRASAPSVGLQRRLSAAQPHSYSHNLQKRPSTVVPVQEADIDIPLTEREQRDADSDLEEFAPTPEKESWFVKLENFLQTVWAFVESILVSLTRHIMKFSRDYRYVSRTLTLEKKVLKEKEGFGIGLREGSQMIWEPLPDSYLATRKLSEISVPEIRILAPSMERGLDVSPEPRSPASCDSDDDTSEHESAFSLQSTESKDVTLLEAQDDSMFKQDQSAILHLIYALWFAVISHTDIVCYIMVFINQIQSATILSIPLPLMVFMWGTLTIPRPTKTFWVTLIAYTEVIVLIKSMFQFEILPWNQKAIPANMPFTAPRIIGIERKSNYALYDLILLLIIFLHRFMLKSLGLWKESTPDIEIHEDMEYPLDPEDTKLLAEGRKEEVAKKYIQLHASTGIRHKTLKHDEAVAQTAGSEEENTERSMDIAEPGPSKPLDDDHYNVNDDQEPIIAVTTTFEDTCKHYPSIMLLSLRRYLRPMQQFFLRMLAPGARVTADVYAYMFLCDFFNFLVVIFGFAAFGTHQGDGGVQAYLEENKVPIPFLVMLILQFALIVIDRALYLRKFILGKILFQYALVIGVHVWMFFVLPFITERTFNTLLPPPMWYMMKSIYLLLSAYQIRCGYPRRIIGNFLCKGYNYVNMLSFRGFMAVPFVFELRTLMDWMWTDTSMTLIDWLKMEDIFANVFLLKCSRYVEDEFPQPRGVKKSTTAKYLLGGTVLAFVIAIIWFPLVFFAFGNTVGAPNPPTDVTVKIRIGPFLPVYQMSAQSHNIDVYSEHDYNQLSNLYARDRTAQTFLSNYMYNDVAVITLNSNSTMNWEISPPELDRLVMEASSNATIKIKFTYVLTHPSNSAQNPPTIEESREVNLEAYLEDGKRNPERDTLLQLLTYNATEHQWLNVSTLFPKFVKVFNKGTAKPAPQLILESSQTGQKKVSELDRSFRNVQMRLEHTPSVKYWRVRESCEAQDPLLNIPMNNCDMLVMYTFNDKLFPETLNFISGSGIIGLYTTFVFLASRLLRGFFSGIFTKIMFEDLPNVDRVLQLCLDIYLVREALELALEEDLFAKLVFLYRSPETMIKWSRPKDEEEEQRALPPSR